ncbi:MAG: redoxin family protein [Pirellulaceae bacterium]
MRRALLLVSILVVSLVGAARADEAEQYGQIRDLLQSGKTAAAEKVFAEAIKEHPDSARLKSLRYLLYAYNNRDENYPAAAEHLEAHIDSMLPSERLPNGNLASLPQFVDMLIALYKKTDKLDAAGKKLDDLLAKVDAAAEQDNQNAQIAARELRNRQILLLADSGQEPQAREMLAKRLTEAEKAVEEHADDLSALLDWVFVLKGGSALADTLGDKDADKKREAYLARLLEAAKQHPKIAALTSTALGEYVSAIGGMSRKQPFEAEKLLEKLQEFAASIESEDPIVKSRVASLARSAPSLQRSIDAGKVHAELIGKEALPLTAEAWVNGTPLTDADLKDKVVLLDFWAVWCGPCIATFPHLREWREKYHDKGLVIIGVTRYYSYDWNSETNRPQREADLSHEDEQAAMLKFAEHHELKHRFMITPDDGLLQKGYGVSGIPQAVLIDRQGKVRLIRVGSGESNAHDIDQMLVELIGDE